jgi:hypothetical protein
MKLIGCLVDRSVTVAAWCKTGILFDNFQSGILYSNPGQSMGVCFLFLNISVPYRCMPRDPGLRYPAK